MKRIIIAIIGFVAMGAAVLPWDVEAARQEERARLERITSTTEYQIELARREAMEWTF